MYIFVAGSAYGALIRTVNVQGREIPYVHFLIPGIVASQVMVATTFAGQTFGTDRRFQMFSQILLLPYSRWEYLLAKMCGILMRAWVTGLVVLLMGAPVIAGTPVTLRGVALALLAITLAGLLFGSLMFLISAYVSDPEGLNVAFSIIAIPVLFLSSVFYPLDRAPEIIRVLGTLNPLSSYAGLLRSALLGIPLESSSLHLLWSLVFTLVSFAVAVVAFGRIEP